MLIWSRIEGSYNSLKSFNPGCKLCALYNMELIICVTIKLFCKIDELDVVLQMVQFQQQQTCLFKLRSQGRAFTWLLSSDATPTTVRKLLHRYFSPTSRCEAIILSMGFLKMFNGSEKVKHKHQGFGRTYQNFCYLCIGYIFIGSISYASWAPSIIGTC